MKRNHLIVFITVLIISIACGYWITKTDRYNNYRELQFLESVVKNTLHQNGYAVELNSEYNILGYEIYRNGKPAGFIERNKNGQETVYTDVVDNINNRVVTYSAVAYDYNLNPTNTVELGTIKVRHEGGIAKSSTILTTNTISLNENHNDIHSHE